MSETPVPYRPTPIAHFITFHTYGTWLHGNEDGSVDPLHNVPGTPTLPADPTRKAQARERMDQPAYVMDAPRRAIVLKTIQEVCAFRSWVLLAVHVRTNHVHVVVQASQAPERVMTDFKAYASRNLNNAGYDDPETKRWTRHGSTRYLWQPGHVEAAIRYVVDAQGVEMAVYENKERIVTCAPANFKSTLKEASAAYTAQTVSELPEYQIADDNDPSPDVMTPNPSPDRQGGKPGSSQAWLPHGRGSDA